MRLHNLGLQRMSGLIKLQTSSLQASHYPAAAIPPCNISGTGTANCMRTASGSVTLVSDLQLLGQDFLNSYCIYPL
jgi:hypothetical protein